MCILDWELTQIIREKFQSMDDKPLGSMLTHLKTKFKGAPIASKTNPLVNYIRTKICRIAHVGALFQRFTENILLYVLKMGDVYEVRPRLLASYRFFDFSDLCNPFLSFSLDNCSFCVISLKNSCGIILRSSKLPLKSVLRPF
jgi:hypothetical protein